MGFLSGLFKPVTNFVKKIFGGGDSGSSGSYSGGGSSSTSTVYDPDRVATAKIEADAKIRLAGMEQERIELMKQAQMDIIHAEGEAKIAIEMARAKGLETMADTIVQMQQRLNEVAEKRLLIIEQGSMQVVKDIEGFYSELEDKIVKDNTEYTEKKLPALLDILEQYQDGTPAHKLYMKRIESDIDAQTKHYMMQLESVAKRQSQVIDSFNQSKQHIIDQTGQITAGLLETIQNQQLALNGDSLNNGQPLLGTAPERQALTDGSK